MEPNLFTSKKIDQVQIWVTMLNGFQNCREILELVLSQKEKTRAS